MLLNVIFLFKQHFQSIVFGSCTSALHQFGVRFQQHQQLSDWPRGLAWMEPLVRGGPSCPSKAMSHETRLATPMENWLTNLRLLPAMQLSCRCFSAILGSSKTSKDPKILWYSYRYYQVSTLPIYTFSKIRTLTIYRYSSQLCRLRSPDRSALQVRNLTQKSSGDSRHRDASAPLQNSWVTGTRTFKIVAIWPL
jgi:hypothetical protein